MLNDPFGRSTLPPDRWTREFRVQLLHEAFTALVAGELPSPTACAFLGGAGLAWLQDGGPTGSFERDFLKVAPPHRSTVTPARLWAQLEASSPRATTDESEGTMRPSDQPE